MGENMGRDLKVGPASPEVPTNPTADLLNETFEAALRGDPEALQALVSLLQTRYGNLIWKRLLHRPRGAQHATLEDIIQESLVDFIAEIKSGALHELPETERRDVVGYFQDLCDRKLKRLKRPRRDPVLAVEKESIPSEVAEDKRLGRQVIAPGLDRKTERHQFLLHQEIGKLDSLDRLVLERYLAGVPYLDISKETGKKVSTLESLITRIKQRLGDRIASQSETAQIHQERKEESGRKNSCLPTAEEILAAVEELPIETQNAIRFIHLKGGSIDQLAKSLGDRGLEKAQARLKRGYESLSVRLDLPFPDSFEGLEK